ncbi:hypothetical protein B0H19DRAFT_1247275 [Mycena capillaripes]|nr:hypothetical protein B0H19DRAFT_1247275 [Mycena capillaripes]
MVDEIRVLCALTDHEEVLETIKFRPGVYYGYEFLRDLQKSHDTRCGCGTRIQRMYKVERDSPPEWDDEPEEILATEISLIGQSDSMLEHFPPHPYKIMVNLMCDAAPPLSPISSSPTSSTGSKRTRSWSADSTSDGGNEQKRAKTRSPSPLSLISSSRKHSLDPSITRLELPYTRFDFPYSCSRPEIAFADKTHFILGLPARFQRILLRPPRFGKTALLSTFAHYYDIHEVENFHKDFGTLAVVTKDPANIPPHNQHLCLSFNFSGGYIPDDVPEFVANLRSEIFVVLSEFVWKYAKELHVPDPIDHLRKTCKNDLLHKVLDLVRTSNYTIFVGVDDYDALIRKSLFPHPDSPAPLHGLATQAELEAAMNSCFWEPLCVASDVIHKLVVTGTFPLNIPALHGFQSIDPGASPGLSPCGFTDEEALEFSQSVMDEPLDNAELHRSCGQYIFPHQLGTTDPVFHPDRLISRISKAISGADSDLSSLRDLPLPYTFTHLPEESSIAEVVTTTGLIDLIATGAIETDAPMGAPIQLDGTTVTWTTLYYLGAVTYDPHMRGTLRLGNSAVLSLVHSHIDKIFADRYDLRERFYRVWKTKGNADVLLEVLTEVLRDQAARSFGRAHEPDLRGIFELVLGNTVCGEPKCIMGPLELFSTTGVSRVKMRDPTDVKRVCYWELRTLTLLGLWRATNGNDDKPTVEALQSLHEELMQDDEERLLARPYSTRSSTRNVMETVLVRSFLEAEPDTPLFLAVGGARVLMRR